MRKMLSKRTLGDTQTQMHQLYVFFFFLMACLSEFVERRCEYKGNSIDGVVEKESVF